MPVGVGKYVCQTVLLFDGISVHPFVCNYTVLCLLLSVCLPTSSSIDCLCIRLSVCPSVHLYAYFVILFITIGLYIFILFIRSSDRPAVLSSSVSINACL